LEAFKADELTEKAGIEVDTSFLKSQFVEQFTLVGIGFIVFLLIVILVVAIAICCVKCASIKNRIEKLKEKLLWNPIIKGF
jgi:cell division protein FtsL